MSAASGGLPNFLLIGAAKAGTTSLYHYLRQHPEIFMSPIKEPRFFVSGGQRPDYRGPEDELLRNTTGVWRLEDYRALFRGVRAERAVGEASSWYLSSERAAAGIRELLPDARLLAVLRDPAERAWSEYLMEVRDGRETLPFAEALRAEPERERAHWASGHYRSRGFYFAHLQPYLRRFDRARLRLYLYEDLLRSPEELLRDVFAFLDVDPGFVPDMRRRHNLSGTLRNPLWRLLWTRTAKVRALVRPVMPRGWRRSAGRFFSSRPMLREPLPAEQRAELVASYREDILRLQDALGRDLSAWLRPSS